MSKSPDWYLGSSSSSSEKLSAKSSSYTSSPIIDLIEPAAAITPVSSVANFSNREDIPSDIRVSSKNQEDGSIRGYSSNVLRREFSYPCRLDDEFLRICRAKYRIPESIQIRAPEPYEYADRFCPGWVCIYIDFFEIGLRFPIPKLICQVCAAYGISLGQLIPNSWRLLMSLELLGARNKIEIGLPEILKVYRLRNDSNKFRLTSKSPERKLILDLENLGNWERSRKDRFFFVQDKGIYAVDQDYPPSKWSSIKCIPSKKFSKHETDLAEERVALILGINPAERSVKKLLSDKSLIGSHLWPNTDSVVVAEEEMSKPFEIPDFTTTRKKMEAAIRARDEENRDKLFKSAKRKIDLSEKRPSKKEKIGSSSRHSPATHAGSTIETKGLPGSSAGEWIATKLDKDGKSLSDSPFHHQAIHQEKAPLCEVKEIQIQGEHSTRKDSLLPALLSILISAEDERRTEEQGPLFADSMVSKSLEILQGFIFMKKKLAEKEAARANAEKEASDCKASYELLTCRIQELVEAKENVVSVKDITIAELEEEIVSLKHQLSSLHQKEVRLSENLNKAAKESASIHSKCAASEKRLEELQQSSEILQKENARLKNTEQDLREKLLGISCEAIMKTRAEVMMEFRDGKTSEWKVDEDIALWKRMQALNHHPLLSDPSCSLVSSQEGASEGDGTSTPPIL